jgi:hypothetical protein
MTRRTVLAAALAAAALLLTACAATATPTSTPTATPTASPTPTLAASACTWTGVRQPVDGGTLGQFAVALTNTSAGRCLLNGAPTVSLTGGRRGSERVGARTSGKFPAAPVLVPAGATAYVPVVLSTTTDGGITGHCTDSRHTTLQVTPPGSPSTISLDVALLHPCAPQPGFGWAVYPVQATMPTVDDFTG